MTMTSSQTTMYIWLLAPWNELWERWEPRPPGLLFFQTRLAGLEVWRHKKLSWDLSGYSERTMSKRPTCRKWEFRGKLSLNFLGSPNNNQSTTKTRQQSAVCPLWISFLFFFFLFCFSKKQSYRNCNPWPELFCLLLIEFYFKKRNFDDNFSGKMEVESGADPHGFPPFHGNRSDFS